MTNFPRVLLAALPAITLALAGCGGGGGNPPNNGASGGGTSGSSSGGAGGSRTGGSGGTPASSGGSGPAQGGSNGGGGTTGGGGTPAGSGGSSADTGANPDVTPGTGGSGQGGSTPPPDGGTDTPAPPAGACDYTPTAAALSKPLKFERIALTGLPAANNNRPYGGGITDVKFLPGKTDEVFITRKSGPVYHYKIAGATATLVSTLAVQDMNNEEDCGLLSVAFDPDFTTNKLVFFAHCTGTARNSKVSRYKYDGGMLTDKVNIITFSAPAGGDVWHSIGSMGFDKDKNLWVVHGEFNTGSPAQSDTSNLGKLIRIVPSREAGVGSFKPAAGNPNGANWYAKGLRSPWRASYQPAKNWWFIADVGPDPSQWEELNIVTQAGANLGWPGGTCNASSIGCWRSGLTTMKIDDADALPDNNATRAGRSVWVGQPYGNCGNDRYDGAMTGVTLTGDFFKGWVIGMTFTDAGAKAKDKSLGSFTMISSIVQGPDGYLYATKFGKYHQGAEGENVDAQGLYRITP
jgi:glucose/arabinose dehydrogenase